ncbi:MAG: ThuA domain-containing protein, partial [Verrucomicrobiota bacterium]
MKFQSVFVFLLVTGFFMAVSSTQAAENSPIRVRVWDEQQPVKKKVYPDFPGNHIAEALKQNERLKITSAWLDQENQGLSSADLQNTDVLVFWGHVRHDAISEEKSIEIVQRIKAGNLAMITLHSAHWSVPFMVAMEDKLAQDALERLPEAARANTRIRFIGKRERKTPPPEKRIAFETRYNETDAGLTIELERPNCVFPRCCTPAQPSQVRMILKDHPIARGVPATFTIPETEMYDEPYHIPAPDLVVLDETWAGGEYFRSGCVWNLGQGKVFYFRPGDQQYAVYKEKPVLQIIENACLWLGEAVLDS